MIIKLSPLRTDDTLEAVKSGDTLKINGEDFDFSQVGEGDTLPASAISSEWFARGAVDRINGALVLTLTLPIPWNYSPEQAFPVPLIGVPDGPVVFPLPLPDALPETQAEEPQKQYALGVINHSTGERFIIPAQKIDGDLGE
jgi:hypothetical protein